MNTHPYVAALVAAFVAAASPKAVAVVYDLSSTPTVSVDTIDGKAWFTTDFTKTTGTGVSNPFLSIQESGSESGFNISSGVLDTKRNGQYTRTQRVSDLQTVTVAGVQYYAFLLDINEPNNSNSLISIEAIKLYTSSNLYTSLGSLTRNATLQFDIDSLSNTTLLYDDRNSGSGQGDIAFFIPKSSLLGVPQNHYFYLYEEFGNCGDYETNAGFEETSHGGGLTFVPIPETHTILPILAVLGVVAGGPFVRRWFST